MLSALEMVTAAMSEHGIILCEHPDQLSLPDSVSDFRLAKQYKYGKICVSLYKKEVN